MNPSTVANQSESLAHTVFERQRLEEQYENLDQQHHAASLGMWVFLATEVMFFGALFLSVAVYRYLYTEAFERASGRLNWQIGGLNTLVLLVSSLTMVLAVHYAQLGSRKRIILFLGLTALLGACFLSLKGLEYYIDYEEKLVPGFQFDSNEWVTREGLRPDQVPHVKLFLFLYWVMTGIHGLHVTIGIGVVLVMLMLAWKGRFSQAYYAPIDVTALYWHFVDIVWIFLLPTLYLLGTHRWGGE
ncbi:MAG: cytochrome c oxidase subunit 3 family protein [Planctomycetaceae bacterium]|nr:cytochrome c oxidase subunit 3 family protein [Planctomycetaceae bacterium]